MKKLLSILLFSPILLQAQTTLYEENFSINVSDWTLNTTDLGGTGSGANSWVINFDYTGGSGEIICLGFPFTFTIPDTPPQPPALDPSPNSHYLHTTSTAGAASGITSCTFLAADGFCTMSESYFAEMNTDFSTIGYSDVTVNFWWLCGGSANNYGEVYYSLDSGATWNEITTPITSYFGQNTWTEQNIVVPELDNQATVRLGYRFVNNTTTSATDPGFGIDEILVTAGTAVEDIEGCTDAEAFNYDPEATVDSGCCFYLDTTIICGLGTEWDATLGQCVITCPGDLDFDGTIGTPDLLEFLGVFGTDCED
jgi:hypothetical protein